MYLDGPPSWRQRGWSQVIDESEDFSEQVPRHRGNERRRMAAIICDRYAPDTGSRRLFGVGRRDQRLGGRVTVGELDGEFGASPGIRSDAIRSH